MRRLPVLGASSSVAKKEGGLIWFVLGSFQVDPPSFPMRAVDTAVIHIVWVSCHALFELTEKLSRPAAIQTRACLSQVSSRNSCLGRGSPPNCDREERTAIKLESETVSSENRQMQTFTNRCYYGLCHDRNMPTAGTRSQFSHGKLIHGEEAR